MSGYPQITEYNEAVQHPETAFLDPELRASRTAENALGLPIVLSGGFALTYRLVGPQRAVAVRCFHREIPAVEQKYAAISTKFRELGSPYFVGFEFLSQGIRVRRQVFPVVKMDWAEGEVLGLWLERNHADPRALGWARDAFAALAQYLEAQRISHGDIQNGNLIISPQGVKLIDYDGVHVPGMPLGAGAESGHKHFQHPERTPRHHGPGIDRFSFIALDLSLAALIEDPSLFRRYGEGGETILFRANDFADPARSEAFAALAQMPALREPAQHFAAICRGPIEAVPTLDDFRALKGTPRPAPATALRPALPPSPPYIGTYPVMGATDFAAVMGHVGHRVELIGRIVSVERGVGAGGRRDGRPYLRIGFSRHWRNTVRLVVWSERGDLPAGLGGDWVGRWVSAVGLIGQPLVSDAFLMPRTSIGIALDDPSKVNFISEQQAQFRLAHVEDTPPAMPLQTMPPPQGAPRPQLGNSQLVARMMASSPPPVARRRAAAAPASVPRSVAPAAGPRDANRNLVRQLRAVPQNAAMSAVRTRPAAPPPPPRPAPSASFEPPVRRRTGRSPVMVLHPRQPGAAPAAAAPPRPAPTPQPTTWIDRMLRKLGFQD